jgi:hypothetical protein
MCGTGKKSSVMDYRFKEIEDIGSLRRPRKTSFERDEVMYGPRRCRR